MHGNTNGSCLVCNGSGNRLSDPPGCISRKLISLPVIKLFHCLDQSQVSFLDQVKEKHSPAHISFGNADNQTEVGLCQALFGLLIPYFHPLCQFDLLICRQKGNLADLLQIHPHRILNADSVGNGQIDVLYIHLVLIRKNDLLVIHIIRIGNPQNINIILLQCLNDLVKLFFSQCHIREKICDLLIFQDIFFLFGKC